MAKTDFLVFKGQRKSKNIHDGEPACENQHGKSYYAVAHTKMGTIPGEYVVALSQICYTYQNREHLTKDYTFVFE